MKPLRLTLAAGEALDVTGVPEGCEGLLPESLAGQPCLMILRDDRRLARVAESLRFFAPERRQIVLPAWDCLPYDRVPPHRDLAAQRMAGLCRLAAWQADGDGRPAGLAVLATVSSVLQRVPPVAVLRDAAMPLQPGGAMPVETLVAFLDAGGYSRVGTVREPGEMAVRGGIIDIFPPEHDRPVRIDMFGDEIETIRPFDPFSQMSQGRLDRLHLYPVSEVSLTAARSNRFRAGYRARFGAVRDGDVLFGAIGAGQRHPAMEHWLPLFYDGLATVFDLVPGAPVLLDHQIAAAVEARLELIGEYYRARQAAVEAARSRRRQEGDGDIYNPLPPDALYLDKPAWQSATDRRAVLRLWPFGGPETGRASIAFGGKRVEDFSLARNRPDINLFDAVCQRIESHRAAGLKVVLVARSAGSRDRLLGLLREHGLADVVVADAWPVVRALPARSVAAVVARLEAGFVTARLAVYTERCILGESLVRRARPSRRAENFIAEVSALSPGDLVVHKLHGIGRYDGLEAISVGGAPPHDCVRLFYDGDDKLFVPVENLDLLTRFGAGGAAVPLDRLGGAGWQARKARARQRIADMAEKLLAVAAARQIRTAGKLLVQAGLYDEFVARFPFTETEDQDKAIADTLEDLGSGRPTDRLVCGDVGFGKTEVALRAAFVAAMSGYQVAVVAPTTLLARQHFRNFQSRFEGLPVRIGHLSRLVSAPDKKAVKAGLADGSVNIVVGTHALLAKSIRFSRLGLLVVDEEQRFGVGQKERLKQLKADIHVLTLTATPIPRTLQLALTGVRELSLIASPPVDRLAVRTFVLPYDSVIIREAIMREHFRGGQVFYVCPRIEDLDELAGRLRDLVPEVRFGMAHGQMGATALEAVMNDFYQGKFPILLSTNIVESGLDIPAANTIVVHRADMFGLGQLYQLRGRVGRAKSRAYAYLTIPADRKLSATAQKRLEVMQTLDTLGAGFSLASHDLDIRGAGNLLGEEQSGHIREVGVELYQQMLEEAVAAARNAADGTVGEATAADWSPTIGVGMPVLIPETYVQDLTVRLGLYRRLAHLESREEIDAFAAELIDRFGKLPVEVGNLLDVIALKRLCRRAGVEQVDAGPRGAVLTFVNGTFAAPDALLAFIVRQAGRMKLRPDHRLVYRHDWAEDRQRLQGVRRLLEKLADMVAAAPPGKTVS